MSDNSTSHFSSWSAYFGLLREVVDPDPVTGAAMRTRVHGFDTCTRRGRAAADIGGEGGGDGTSWGFMVAGTATLVDGAGPEVRLSAGQHFCVPGAFKLSLDDDTRVVVVERAAFTGLRSFGGPIEAAGRLRYIDGCSDTLLVAPPRQGDPCLNHLHFPAGVRQTSHTHPSSRAGVVARGAGWCETPAGRSALLPGVVFHIPRGGRHRFLTEDASLDVIAYHPDSDWGPTDENHPMLNRTWVDGEKIDNTADAHRASELVDGSR